MTPGEHAVATAQRELEVARRKVARLEAAEKKALAAVDAAKARLRKDELLLRVVDTQLHHARERLERANFNRNEAQFL